MSERHKYVQRTGPRGGPSLEGGTPTEVDECAVCGQSILALEHTDRVTGVAVHTHTRVQPTAALGCEECGAGDGEYHRQGCPTRADTLPIAPEIATPPAPTGEPGDPAQGPGSPDEVRKPDEQLVDLGAVRRQVEQHAAGAMAQAIDAEMLGAGSTAQAGCSSAQADWRDSQPRVPRVVLASRPVRSMAELTEEMEALAQRQGRRQPIVAVGPTSIPRNTRLDVEAEGLHGLAARVATLEAQAESVGAGLSRCESSVAGMTTTHADRIETIEDDVLSMKRALLELRELSFGARHGASDQKLSILINGEPAPYSSFRIPEAADHVRCPRCGSDDPDRYVICTGGDTTEPHFKASCHYLKDSDLWHEAARATRGVGTKRPTHARLVRAVERWVGGYAIPAGTVLEIIGWSVDYPRIANPVAPANHPEPWFTLHPGEWETCEGPTQAKGRPVVVCLCGSTRFHQNFIQANERLTLEGKIVLSVGSFGYANGVPLTEEQKVKLDELHKRKIDMADEVLVLNVGGYVGSSTRGEIQYAWDHGKRVTFLEPMDIGEVRSAVAWGEKGGVS